MKLKLKLMMGLVAILLALSSCYPGGREDKKSSSPDQPRARAKEAPTAAKEAAAPATAQKAQPAQPAADPDSGVIAEYKLKFESGRELKINRYQAKWKAKDKAAGEQWAVKIKEGKYRLLIGDKEVAEGRRDEDKLKFKKADGSIYLKLKFKDDKIKVSLTEEEDGWEIKYKEDKVKVELGAVELGKVKFYPDDGKLKVKDAKDVEIASMKEYGKLTGALAPFAIPELSDERKIHLMLILFALDK